jgi:hypothetical protein
VRACVGARRRRRARLDRADGVTVVDRKRQLRRVLDVGEGERGNRRARACVSARFGGGVGVAAIARVVRLAALGAFGAQRIAASDEHGQRGKGARISTETHVVSCVQAPCHMRARTSARKHAHPHDRLHPGPLCGWIAPTRVRSTRPGFVLGKTNPGRGLVRASGGSGFARIRRRARGSSGPSPPVGPACPRRGRGTPRR